MKRLWQYIGTLAHDHHISVPGDPENQKNKRMKNNSLVLLLPVLLLFAACGGPPAENPLLEEARTGYKSAEQDNEVVQFAPVALKEAEEALQMGHELWQARADKVYVEHYAYLAKQKTAIAVETARMNAAQHEIERAESERQRVLIDVRRRDAQRAEERAQRALEELQRERELAEQARREAEELARRINDLEARQTERGLVLTLGDVLFDFDRAVLRPGGMRTVRELANFLNQYPERNVMIEGHTDSIGSQEYNLDLSERRADAVRVALIERGIAANRIQIKGYGKLYPVTSNATESGRQQNRRVEVIISDEEGVITDRGD